MGSVIMGYIRSEYEIFLKLLPYAVVVYLIGECVPFLFDKVVKLWETGKIQKLLTLLRKRK